METRIQKHNAQLQQENQVPFYPDKRESNRVEVFVLRFYCDKKFNIHFS